MMLTAIFLIFLYSCDFTLYFTGNLVHYTITTFSCTIITSPI